MNEGMEELKSLPSVEITNAEEELTASVTGQRTRLFLDAEFTGLYKDADLISVSLVSEDSREFYAELNCFDEAKVSDWVMENVLQNLTLNEFPDKYCSEDMQHYRVKGCKTHVSRELRNWLEQFGPCEIWTDLGAYDIVLVQDLFGGAKEFEAINDNVYLYYFDLCTRFKERGIDPDVSREEFAQTDKWGLASIYASDVNQKHNARWDAYVLRECWRRSALFPIFPLTDKQMADLKGMWEILGEPSNADYDQYSRGLHNGAELMMAIIENRDPQFKSPPPEGFLVDRPQPIGELTGTPSGLAEPDDK